MSQKNFTLLAVLKADTAHFNKNMKGGKKTLLDVAGGGKLVNQALLKATGALTGFLAANKLKDVALDSVRLAAKAQGVERAFNKLNNPNLLNDLRTATKGTIDDLTLMKYAVQARNFKIPLDQLSTYFKFATNRAAETGESVDYLVNSILTGLGRESVLIMDNLGISAKDLSNKTKELGNFSKAANAIIQEELEKTGEVMKTDAQRAAELNANLENQKRILGEKLLPIYSSFLKGVNNVIGGVTSEISTLKRQKEQINLNILSITALKEGTQERTQAINQLKAAYPSYFGNLDAEKAKNEDLSKALKQVNEDYANRIVIAEYEKELGKVAKAEEKLESNRINSIKHLNNYADKYGQTKNSLDELIESVKSFIEYQESGNAAVGVAKGELLAYKNAVSFLEGYNDELAEIGNQKQGIEAAKNNLLSMLGVQQQLSGKGGPIDEGEKERIKNLEKMRDIYADKLQIMAFLKDQTAKFLGNDGISGPTDQDFTLTQRDDSLAPSEGEIDYWRLMTDEIQNADNQTAIFMNSIGALGNAFQQLFADGEAGFKQVGTVALQTIKQIIDAYLAAAIAGMIKGEAGKGLVGLVTASIGVSALIGLWQSKVPNFAAGGVFSGSGIVPGTSYTGDKINAHLNSGERVMNVAEQQRLTRMLSGGAISKNQGLKGSLQMRGTDIVILIEQVLAKQNAIN